MAIQSEGCSKKEVIGTAFMCISTTNSLTVSDSCCAVYCEIKPDSLAWQGFWDPHNCDVFHPTSICWKVLQISTMLKMILLLTTMQVLSHQFNHLFKPQFFFQGFFLKVEGDFLTMSSVCRFRSLDWKKDRNWTEPNCNRPDHRLWLHKFWNFSVASCDVWPVFKGPVAVPEYLKRSRLVAVASCLVLREKNWT